MTMVAAARSRAFCAAVGCALVLSATAQNDVEPIDSESDRMPANTVIPEYPEQARLERIEGEVQVCFDITREGLPRRVTIRHSTHRYFERPARNAVRRSTWRPLPRGEKVPNIKACRTFRFRLVPVPPDERD